MARDVSPAGSRVCRNVRASAVPLNPRPRAVTCATGIFERIVGPSRRRPAFLHHPIPSTRRRRRQGAATSVPTHLRQIVRSSRPVAEPLTVRTGHRRGPDLSLSRLQRCHSVTFDSRMRSTVSSPCKGPNTSRRRDRTVHVGCQRALVRRPVGQPSSPSDRRGVDADQPDRGIHADARGSW
jgi:hypothetical protein